MIFNCKSNFAGQETKISKETGKPYTIVRIIEKDGRVFSMMAEGPIANLNQFQPVSVEVEVIQGQYPKYNLVSIKQA